jgi:hypothetical protein
MLSHRLREEETRNEKRQMDQVVLSELDKPKKDREGEEDGDRDAERPRLTLRLCIATTTEKNEEKER